jgi:hypothetical protein
LSAAPSVADNPFTASAIMRSWGFNSAFESRPAMASVQFRR